MRFFSLYCHGLLGSSSWQILSRGTLTEPQNVRLFSRNICRSLDDRLSIMEHVQALEYLLVRGHSQMAISRTTTRAISGTDSIHKGRTRGAGKISFFLIPSLHHSAAITLPNCLSFPVHPRDFLSFQSYCRLDFYYSPSLPSVYFGPEYILSFAFLAPEMGSHHPVLDALEFWIPSNLGYPPVLDALIRYWLPSYGPVSATRLQY